MYYPLVGGVDVSWDGRMLVDCGGGDGGVPFVEAFSDEEMAAAVGDIALIDDKLKNFVYCNHTPYHTILDVPPLSVQVTTFKCGGIILGVGFNHVLIDGRGFSDFLMNWSQFAKGLPISTCPNLDKSIFSPNQSPQIIQIPHPEYSKSKSPLIPSLTQNQRKIMLNNSFCFTPTKFSQLKKLALHNNNDNNNNNNNPVSRAPTDFELISALVWICWTKATRVSPEKTTQILTAVDGRPKLQPPLPPGYFGNGIVWSCARSRAEELTSQPFSYTVGIVHDAIKAVTEDSIRSAMDFHEVTRKPLEQENTLWITKWSRLPFYEADFGWGTAEQVAPASLVDNLVVSLSQGKDITRNLVISVRLPAEEMEVFKDLIQSELN
ncbi:hypothetical protein C2S53_010795 [Perilla frutescens var. hirtella]|uniref:Uncharacterized protein n=1 Tax=Perilla frutescens var. hirtella TaxID=608512 RepID=A0AAD4JQR4_PERFH|nr:hypothetical protein C2S53_010795 [Perilla frutescens var. hirtella]